MPVKISSPTPVLRRGRSVGGGGGGLGARVYIFFLPRHPNSVFPLRGSGFPTSNHWTNILTSKTRKGGGVFSKMWVSHGLPCHPGCDAQGKEYMHQY